MDWVIKKHYKGNDTYTKSCLKSDFFRKISLIRREKKESNEEGFGWDGFNYNIWVQELDTIASQN